MVEKHWLVISLSECSGRLEQREKENQITAQKQKDLLDLYLGKLKNVT